MALIEVLCLGLWSAADDIMKSLVYLVRVWIWW